MTLITAVPGLAQAATPRPPVTTGLSWTSLVFKEKLQLFTQDSPESIPYSCEDYLFKNYTTKYITSYKDNVTLSTNKNSAIFNRPSDWLMAESWEVSWEIYDMEGLEVRIDLQTKSSQMFSWQHWATEHWMSESVQSLVLDINYQNVNLHNDDTVEHLDNVDERHSLCTYSVPFLSEPCCILNWWQYWRSKQCWQRHSLQRDWSLSNLHAVFISVCLLSLTMINDMLLYC